MIRQIGRSGRCLLPQTCFSAEIFIGAIRHFADRFFSTAGGAKLIELFYGVANYTREISE